MRAQMKVIIRVLPVFFVALFLCGCGGGEGEPESTTTSKSSSKSESDSVAEAEAAPGAPSPGGGAVGQSGTRVQKVAAIERKIIYTADVTLVVERLSPAQQKLLALVRKHGGYIAETNVSGQTGAPRTGRWKVRVPVNGYQNFLDGVAKIGEVQTLSSNSSDVSEEFYDIEARLRNKRLEEKRLLEHLNRSTAKLSEILTVEKEISRVRGEIEQMQGRLRVLESLTSLTTITVNINEVKDYVPPAPPTFMTQIARTFSSSLGGLVNFGKGLVLLIVGVAPWLIFLIVAIPLWKLARRRYPTHPKNPQS